MGESSRTTRRLNAWFWWLMYVLPIIVFIIACFRSTTAITPETVGGYIDGFLSDALIINSNEIKTAILGVFEPIFGTSPYISAVVSFGMYMIFVKLMHLIVDVFSLIPDVCSRLINMLPGGKEV